MPVIATIVVPTHQRAEHLRLCLTSIDMACAEVPAGSFNVVVTDDSRDDLSAQLVASEFKTVRYVQGPRRGPATNRNFGAALATTPWLVFIDDDCIADRGWLVAYSRAFSANDGEVLFEGRTRADRPRRSYAEESPTNETGGYLWSCNMAISTALFREVGGFCDSFPHPALEDVDLRLRLQRRGHRATFLPHASVCHPYRPMRGIEFLRMHNASYAHLLQLHPELGQALSWSNIVLNTLRILLATARSGLRYGPRGTGRVLYSAVCKALIDARFLRRRARLAR